MNSMSKMFRGIVLPVAMWIGVCVAGSRADFQTDLENMCKWCGADPYNDPEVTKIREKYEKLYANFKADVAKECKVLREKNGVASGDPNGMFGLMTEGEVQLLTFGQRLWEYVGTYAKKSRYEVPRHETVIGISCRYVFVRRMFGCVQFCIRSFSGRFGTKEFFDEKACVPNEKIATEILKPYSRADWYLDGGVKKSLFSILDTLKKELEQNLSDAKAQMRRPGEGCTEFWNSRYRADKVYLEGLLADYRTTVNSLYRLCVGVSEKISKYRSGLPAITKEDFDAFLKRIGGSLEGVLKLYESSQRSSKENEETIRAELEAILSEKDKACDFLSEKAEELKELERKFNFVTCCSDLCTLRKKLAEICRETKGGDQSCRKKEYDEIKRKLQQANDYRSKLEALRREVREAEERVMTLTEKAESEYKDKKASLNFSVSAKELEEQKCVDYALKVAKCNAFLKSVVYLHTLAWNVCRAHISEVMKLHREETLWVMEAFRQPDLDKVELTDDFDEESIEEEDVLFAF